MECVGLVAVKSVKATKKSAKHWVVECYFRATVSLRATDGRANGSAVLVVKGGRAGM